MHGGRRSFSRIISRICFRASWAAVESDRGVWTISTLECFKRPITSPHVICDVFSGVNSDSPGLHVMAWKRLLGCK